MSWQDAIQQVKNAATPAERRAAAEALAKHIPTADQHKVLVGMQKGGVNVVSLGDLPRAMEDPAVYEQVKKVVTGG